MRQCPSIIALMTPYPEFLQPLLLHKMLMTFWARKHPLHIMHLLSILHNQPLQKFIKEKLGASLPQAFFQLQIGSRPCPQGGTRANTCSRPSIMGGSNDPRTLFTGKVLVMNLFEAGLLHMSIDLCRGNAGMAKHHLDRTKIGAMIQ